MLMTSAALTIALLLSACTNQAASDGIAAAAGQSSGETIASAVSEASGTATTGTESTTSSETTAAPTPTPEPTPEPKLQVRAVYVSGPMAGVQIDHFIELCDQTELNALVIDVKENGVVNYASDVPLVKEIGAFKKNMKVAEVLQKCHDHGIYVIGRVVCFRDDVLSRARQSWAVQRASGGIWTENKIAWLNPSVEEVQQYNIDIAKEAVSLGFDEIQFDYVRFPTSSKSNPAVYSESMPEKKEVIAGFLKNACAQIKEVKDVPVTADIFGIVAESIKDGEAIGQHLETVGAIVDAICPMVYPSHYANAGHGTMGNGVGQDINGVLFTAPDLKPYDVVYQTMLRIQKRSAASADFKAVVRPYLQDFTATYLEDAYSQTYGDKQIREQIQAVYDSGYREWILWDGRNTYTETALLTQAQADAEAVELAGKAAALSTAATGQAGDASVEAPQSTESAASEASTAASGSACTTGLSDGAGKPAAESSEERQ